MDLIFATNNKHKIDEVQALVGNDIVLRSLDDIGCSDDIPETGVTFAENASQKSHFIFDRFQLNCFGDDSGLEVDALNGQPGVYSARYGGTRNPEANLQLVLDNLGHSENRSARFRTVISLIINGREYFFEGAAEGSIARVKSGAQGFGYDPIFIPAGFDITFADMSAVEKNAVSHRAKAMEQLIGFLKSKA